jgi:heme-degrading monooxygenase HmoA
MVIAMFNTEKRADIDTAEYQQAVKRMMDIVTTMPGFISVKGYKADDGETVTMATFETEEALDAWRTHPEHRATQERGYEEFYDSLWVRVCTVVRSYEWTRPGRR